MHCRADDVGGRRRRSSVTSASLSGSRSNHQWWQKREKKRNKKRKRRKIRLRSVNAKQLWPQSSPRYVSRGTLWRCERSRFGSCFVVAVPSRLPCRSSMYTYRWNKKFCEGSTLVGTAAPVSSTPHVRKHVDRRACTCRFSGTTVTPSSAYLN